MNYDKLDEDKNEHLLAMEVTINQCFNNKSKMIKFPDELESYFNEYDMPIRKKRFIIMGLIGLFFYNIFMVGDMLMLPDIYQTAWLIRGVIVTPIAVISLLLLKFNIMRKDADFIASMVIFSIAASILLMLLISNHPNVVHYHTGILVVITFSNLIMMPRFNYALLFSLAICLLYVLTALNITLMDKEIVTNSCFVLFANTLLTLVGNFHLRLEQRREFLFKLLRQIDSIKLEESNRLLEKISISDKLTNLSNRRHFDFTFDKEWKSSLRTNSPISMIFIDIDYFKNYNDYYGHPQGDACLKMIAKALSNSIKRPRDFVARYGGEEFVILLPDIKLSGASVIAEKIRQSIEKLKIPHEVSPRGSFVTISLGVASLVPTDENEANDLTLYADKALYVAKSEGKNRVHEYTELDY